MEINKTLQPGEMGTKRFLNEYGDQLVCVRYRINKQLQKRYTTVELIIDERPYIKQKATVMVMVKIHYDETELRQQVRAFGAKWNPEDKSWGMEYELAKKLGLKQRIIKKTIKGDV
ncbi:MAG: hypothetical protein OEY06_12625 [Gammaproteobacteria bacterium]|nr:hypothetical protein [Gammaproteobacteria bacterium]